MVRKTAIGLLLAGFVFIFFSLTVGGIDLLIDAVGFVLVFNGAKALRQANKAFWPAALLALALLVLSAGQLFAKGVLLVWLSLARMLGEAALLLLLQMGLYALLRADGWRWDAMAVRISFCLCAFFSTACAGYVVYTRSSARPPALSTVGLAAHLLAAGALLHSLLIRGRQFVPRPGAGQQDSK